MVLTFIQLKRDFITNEVTNISVVKVPVEKVTDKMLIIPKDRAGDYSRWRHRLPKEDLGVLKFQWGTPVLFTDNETNPIEEFINLYKSHLGKVINSLSIKLNEAKSELSLFDDYSLPIEEEDYT